MPRFGVDSPYMMSSKKREHLKEMCEKGYNLKDLCREWKTPFSFCVSRLSNSALMILWEAFSRVQCAEYLKETPEGVQRFIEWLKSGNDDDAWS